jgi:uncharacterized membrane protein YphA (DoxX/SURF4 family)
MENFLLSIHSIVRWIVVVVAVIALLKFAAGWLGKMPFQSMDRGLMAGFTGLLDLQLLLGIILLIVLGIERYRLEHAFTMIIALVLVHLARRWREAPDAIRFRNNFLVILAAILLIIAGVLVLPQGWFG